MVTLAAWLHDLDPFVVRFVGDFGIRWYAISYLLGFTLAYVMLRAMAGRGLILLSRPFLLDAMLLIGVGVIVGARLGYVLLYQPSLLWTFDGSFPFWGLLKINKGGMASHGGMIGVLIAAWRVSRGFRGDDGKTYGACPPLHVVDALVLVAPVGLLLGRLANFVNGELLGRVVAGAGQPAPWWAVRFPQEHLTGHDVALSDEARAALDQLALEHTLPSDPPSEFFGAGYSRVIEKLQSGSAEIAERLEPLVSARHPSQLYQALAEGVVTLGVVWLVFRRPRAPGVVSAWFLIVYGLGRIATEFWRLPDDHFGGTGFFDLTSARPLGLSRGQWLSVLMFVAGVGLLVVLARRGGERLGGWASARSVAPPSSQMADGDGRPDPHDHEAH